jgi:membrane protein implicated in regulation of membrane protease activity
MRLLATAHPPALAIALIPLILEAVDPAAYVAAIATGAAALYVGAFAVALAARRALRAPQSVLSAK